MKNKNAFVFLISVIAFATIEILTDHYCGHKGISPQSWEEIWNDKWSIIFFAVVVGAVITYEYDKIYHSEKKDK